MAIDDFVFSEVQVLTFTGLRKGRLRYWDRIDFIKPSFRVDRKRVYSFRDLVSLRVCKHLRDSGVSRQLLGDADTYLRQWSETPWASLRIYRFGKSIYFRNPDTGSIENLDKQIVFDEVIKLEDVVTSLRSDVEKRRSRSADQIGRIERRRAVLRNRPVIAGTRIPTSAIWAFHEDGYSETEIIGQYPALTSRDVQAAIEYEREQRIAS